MRKVVAIIPARGGSKGIPNKNLIDFCGKPLVAWTIEQALAVSDIHSVWVTSDSERILDLSTRCGARAIQRPMELSGDSATSESAWIHAISDIEKDSSPVDLVIGLQATSPIREPGDLEKGLRDFNSRGCDSLFSASLLEDLNIWQAAGGVLESLNYDYKNRTRRQDAMEQYVENGSFYIFRPNLIRDLNNRLGGKIGMSLMEFWKSFEIDSLESLELCETLMKHYLLSPKKFELPKEELL